jgi:hypothetical protein
MTDKTEPVMCECRKALAQLRREPCDAPNLVYISGYLERDEWDALSSPCSSLTLREVEEVLRPFAEALQKYREEGDNDVWLTEIPTEYFERLAALHSRITGEQR